MVCSLFVVRSMNPGSNRSEQKVSDAKRAIPPKKRWNLREDREAAIKESWHFRRAWTMTDEINIANHMLLLMFFLSGNQIFINLHSIGCHLIGTFRIWYAGLSASNVKIVRFICYFATCYFCLAAWTYLRWCEITKKTNVKSFCLVRASFRSMCQTLAPSKKGRNRAYFSSFCTCTGIPSR